jgi:hypothetical protein
VRITDLNKPENIISGFAPELFGRPLDDEDVLEQRVLEKQGVPYYEWCVHCAVVMHHRMLCLRCEIVQGVTWCVRDAGKHILGHGRSAQHLQPSQQQQQHNCSSL